MNVRVYLIQHGEAKPPEPDAEPVLTENGRRDVEKTADFLRPLGITLDAVWHSVKTRAQQTAEIFASAVSTQNGVQQRDGLKPNDPVAPVKHAIEQAAGDLMIVGHLPFLGKLASLLVTGDETKPTVTFQNGCVVCMERQPEQGWTVAWMIVPGLFKT
jgi:phosphohistidine phosphatase